MTQPKPHPFDAHHGPLRTRVGAFFPGERVVFRGQDLHHDLGDASWMDVYVFGITGRRHSVEQLRVLEALWSYTSYPDTRLWNNRVAALAGSARSTGNLGVSAGLAISEAAIYGRQIDIRAISFLQNALRVREAGGELLACIEDELQRNRSIAGYGRPLINGDERLAPMRALLAETGLDKGRHLQVADEIERILLAGRWRFKMNYAGLAASICADMGMSMREYYAFAFPTFVAGMQPCYAEAIEKPEGAVMPIRCEEVNYTGPSVRSWR